MSSLALLLRLQDCCLFCRILATTIDPLFEGFALPFQTHSLVSSPPSSYALPPVASYRNKNCWKVPNVA